MIYLEQDKKNYIYVNCPDVFFTEACNLRCDYCFEKKRIKHLNVDKLRNYVKEGCFTSFFPFGGEPLVKFDLFLDILNSTNRKRKKLLTKNLITNGTLLPMYVDKIAENRIKVQISIDGPQYVHDKHRVYKTGKGSWYDVVTGISSILRWNYKHRKEEKLQIDWSMHGVICRDTLQYFSDSIKWYFDLYFFFKGKEKAIEHMAHNMLQVIFEEDYDDKDVDILLEQFYKIADWIAKDRRLTKEERRKLLLNIVTRRGGVCGIGTGLYSFDTELDVYPCHRVATINNKEEYMLGNLEDRYDLKNYKVYNSFMRLKKSRQMYSSTTNIDGGKFGIKKENNRIVLDKYNWFMWCPATNLETSGTPHFQNAKYNVLFTEINNAIPDVINYLNIKLMKNKKEQNNYCGI